jgi:hypothetical protein
MLPFSYSARVKIISNGFLAIFAVELIARHEDLRKNATAAGLLIYGVRSESLACAAFTGLLMEGAD